MTCPIPRDLIINNHDVYYTDCLGRFFYNDLPGKCILKSILHFTEPEHIGKRYMIQITNTTLLIGVIVISDLPRSQSNEKFQSQISVIPLSILVIADLKERRYLIRRKRHVFFCFFMKILSMINIHYSKSQ